MKNILILILLFSLGYAQKESLSLDDCIQIALTNKEALKASALDLESSRQSVKGSYSNILPSLILSGSLSESSFPQQEGGYNPTTGEITLGSISNLKSSSAGISLSQNIYDGGRWWNNIAQSKNNYKITEQFNRQVKTNIIREVHRNYFNYLKSLQLLDVSQSNLNSSQQQLALTKQRFDLGSARKTDLLKAEVRYGQARVDVVNNEAVLNNAFLSLKNAMGIVRTSRDFIVNDDIFFLDTIPDFENAFESIQKYNPSVLAKKNQITNAEFNEKLAKGSRFPNISATASYSGNSEDFQSLSDEWDQNWRMNTSLSFSVPIYTGNTLSTTIQQAKLNVRKQESEYLTQLQDLSVQLELILDQLNYYKEVIPINEKVLASAEEDVKLVQERYSLGSASILEVLDAQVSLVTARSSLIRSKYDSMIEQANMKAILGTLDTDL
ncbi:MAG: TolC family protein [Candidatus Neomarinimicrobiota bacterium]|nr:TolC family protein [Candidatus Neomarinimicrobiota bacterium]